MIKIKQKLTQKTKDKIQLALRFQQAGNFQQAEQIYREIIKKQKNNAHIYCNLGLISQEKGQLDDAINYYRKAIGLNPDLAQAQYNLGVVLQGNGNFEDAIACYHKAIQLEENPLFYFNLGSALQEQGNLDDAEACYRRALELDPGYAKAHNNLGIVFKQRMQLAEAMLHIEKALQLDPDFAEAHVNLAGMHMMSGDFQEGWKEFEWRKKMKHFRHRHFSQPHWDGSDISGRTILIYNEQEAKGFGDTIQCARYVSLVAERGARVVVECQKELITLFRNIDGVNTIIAEGERLPNFDVHCHFLSLPSLFHTSLDTIPTRIPYLSVDASFVQRWSRRIQSRNSQLKIGLVWAGDKKHERLQLRSCSDELLSLRSHTEGVRYFSLQKGEASQYANGHDDSMKLIDFMEEIHDFSDTAALMLNLDLIISVDTAVAHLAGALGRPVWTLLPYIADARWLINRDDTPWYPTMRLFRQPSPGDWKTVVSRIEKEIQKLLPSAVAEK